MKNRRILLWAVLLQGACAKSESAALPGLSPVNAMDAQAFVVGDAGGDLAAPVVPRDAEQLSPSLSDSGTSTPGMGTGVPPSPVSTDGSPGAPAGVSCGAALCNDGPAGSGARCEQAITIGRASLLNVTREYLNSTVNSGGNQDLTLAGCKDEGNDVFYRVYLYPGEVLNLSVRNRTSDRDISVKIYLAADCTPPSSVVCIDKGGNNLSELVYQQAALGEGWHYIVVDGPAGAGGEFSISRAAPFAAAVNACSC